MEILERRRFERFAVAPMYTGVWIRPLGGDCPAAGHAYNLSEGGVQCELDVPIPSGTPVEVEMLLPGGGREEGRLVRARGRVAWMLDDPDEPGPVRLGVCFEQFASRADRERLLRQFAGRRLARAG